MKKYKQIFKLLEQDILNEKYQINDYLPSEHELVQTYKVSRDTIRKSLDLLQKLVSFKKGEVKALKSSNKNRLTFPFPT